MNIKIKKNIFQPLLGYIFILILLPIFIHSADLPNQPPSFNLGPNQEVNEDNGRFALSNFAQGMSPGHPDESGQTIKFYVSASNQGLFSSLPAISPQGTLSFTPKADMNGSSIVSVYLKDNGGTANGGVDQSETKQFTIKVRPVNDAPTFVKGENQTVIKGSGLQTISQWATRIKPGPSDEANQTLTFEVETDSEELFRQLPRISSNGTLSYEPGIDAYGKANISVVLKDDGGVANGGVDISIEEEFTISIVWANQAPSFTKGPDIQVLEDAGDQAFIEWATNIKAGPPEEDFQTVDFHLYVEQLRLFAAQPAITSNGKLTFRSAPDINGKTIVNIFLKDDGGIEFGGQDTSSTQDFFIEIKPVNDPPSFIPGSSLTIPQNADLQEITAWAKDISPGPPDEANQSVQFIVSTDKPELFQLEPEILENGTLRYKAAKNAYGKAKVSVKLMDNGLTYDNGIDTSEEISFYITIVAINQVPFFTPGEDITIDEDFGLAKFDNWATEISAGSPNESYQKLVFFADGFPSDMFKQTPMMLPDGTLSFEIGDDLNGEAQIRIYLKDDGGTADGGKDQSEYHYLKVNISPVNDPPRPISEPLTVQEDTPASYTMFAIDIENDPIQYKIFIPPSKGTLILENTITGQCIYHPYTNSSGTDYFQFKALDHKSASEPASVTININPVNDPPGIYDIAPQTIIEDTPTEPIPFFVFDSDNDLNDLSLKVTSSNRALVPDWNIQVQGDLSEPALIITPEPNMSGKTTIVMNISDKEFSSQTSFALTVVEVNDAPTISTINDQIIDEDQTSPPISFYIDDPDTSISNLRLEVEISDPSMIQEDSIQLQGEDTMRTIALTPERNVSGDVVITIRVLDDHDAQASESFNLKIVSENDPPLIDSIEPQQMLEDAQFLEISFTVSDPDTPLDQISIKAKSSAPNLIADNQITISGDGENRLIKMIPMPNQNGSLSIELTASDGLLSSPPVSFSVEITPVNDPPVANAGDDITIGEGRSVILDGSGSTDPENRIIFYQWIQVSGVKVIIDDATKPQISFDAPMPVGPNGVSLVFNLTVTDHEQVKSSDTIQVFVEDMVGQHTINASSGEHGQIVPSGRIIVKENESQTFAIQANANADILDVLIDDVPIGPEEAYTFENVVGDHTIQALFKVRPKVAATVEGGGTITPSGDVYVLPGEDLSFSFLPDENYQLDYLLVDSLVIGPKSSYHFFDIQSDHSIKAIFKSRTIYVTIEAGKRGTIEPSGQILVDAGSDLDIKFIPDPGYEVAEILINGASIGQATSHKLYNIHSSISVSATFKPIIAQTIYASSDENGSISPEGEIKVSGGLSQSFTFVPNETFQVAKVFIDDVEMGPMDRYTFPSVEKDHHIHVTFEHQPKITATANPNGSIVPEGDVYVKKGWYQAFSIIPDKNYEILDVKVDETSMDVLTDHILLEVTEDMTIQAFFQKMPKIKASADDNGKIWPSGELFVPRNSFNQFRITLDPGYQLDQLFINGEVQPLLEDQLLYTIPAITEDYTIHATFVLDEYIIDAKAGGSGQISPTGRQTCVGNQDQTFWFIPDSGYEVSRVMIDGINFGRFSSYTFKRIVENHTIYVEYIKKPVIRAQAGSHGQIQPNGQVGVRNGAYQTFMIKPDKGYKVASIIVDNEPVSVTDDTIHSENLWKQYVFSNVIADHEIMVTFSRCHIELRTNGNGEISPDTNLYFDVFDDVSFTFTPDYGYVIDEIIVDDKQISPQLYFNFWELTEDHTLEVNFRAMKIHTITATANEGGSLSPTGPMKVLHGDYAEFIIDPDEMYELSKIIVNGKVVNENSDDNEVLPVGKDGFYVSLNVTTDQVIDIQFQPIPEYEILAIASGNGGRVEPSGFVKVRRGQYQLFTFHPEPGYGVKSVEVDGRSMGVLNSYAFSAMKDHEIIVRFYSILTRVISGKIVDRMKTFQGLENFIVEVWEQDQLLQTTISNVNGEYRIESLPASDNLIIAVRPPSGNEDYYPLFYNNERDRRYADSLSTLSGNLDNIDFEMQRTFEEGIRGQVRKGDTGIAHVMVDVFEDSATFVKNVLTDENGFYTLTGLDPTEDYKVSVWYEPFTNEYFYRIPDFTQPGEVVPTESVFSWDRASIFRSQYPPLENIDIIIDPGAIISGTVLLPDGDPATGIRVNAVSYQDRSGNSALTNASGQYTITGLIEVLPENAAIDGYFVEILPLDYPYMAYPQAAHISQAEKVATGRNDIDFQLKEGHHITGRIFNTDAMPLPDIQISVWSLADPDFKNGHTISDINGFYTISNLPIARDYVLSATDDGYPINYYANSHHLENAQPIDIFPQSVTGINLILNKGSVISGQVFINESRSPAAGIWVNVWSESTQTGGDVITNENGFYEQSGLDAHANDYQISVIHPDYQPAFYKETPDDNPFNDTVNQWQDADRIAPTTSDQAIQRNLVLDKGLTFSAYVTYKDEPVANVVVEMFSEETGGWGSAVSNDLTPSNLIIEGLIPGIYTIKTSSESFADVWITAINPDEITSVYPIALELPGKKISGTLVGLKKGEVVRINAWSKSINFNGFSQIVGTGYAVNFTIQGLKPASDYLVEAFSKNYPKQIYDGRNTTQTADLIDITSQDARDLVFRFEATGNFSISGEVTFPQDAQEGESVQIEAWSNFTDELLSQMLTFNGVTYSIPYTLVGRVQNVAYQVDIQSDPFIDQTITSIDTLKNPVITHLDFTLERGAAISGKVVDSQGKGIEQLEMIAWSNTLGSGCQTRTISDGSFMFEGLKDAQDYTIEIIHEDLGRFYYNQNKIVRDQSQATHLNTQSENNSDIEIVIDEGVSIQGRVMDTQGELLSNIRVEAWSSSTQSGNSVFTDSNGNYQINGLTEANDYQVKVLPEHYYFPSTKDHITAPRDNLDFRLTATQGFRVYGTVFNSNEIPLNLARVEIQSAINDFIYVWDITNDDGSYAIEQVPEGNDYIITVLPPNQSEAALYRETNMAITSQKQIDIHLEPELLFAGKLTNESGLPVTDARVVVFSAASGFWDETYSNESGDYEIHQVPSGSDYMLVIDSDNYLESKQMNLTPGVDINFELETGGVISGEVKLASTGKGMPDIPVEVFSMANAGLSNYGGIATTDANGQYKVSQLKINNYDHLPLDDYVVFIYPENYPLQSRGNKTTGEIVNFVVAGGEDNQTVGTVVIPEDATGIFVDVFESGGYFVTCGQVFEDGTFVVSGLHANKKYQYRFQAKFADTTSQLIQWAGENDKGVDIRGDSKSYSVPSTIYFEFTSDTRKRTSDLQVSNSGPGPVRNLRSTSHAFQTVNLRKRSSVSASGPETVSNDPTVSVGWDPPDSGAENLAGYYGQFTNEASLTFDKLNTADKPPIRTRKITSQDLEGDDVLYYFNVAAVDVEGRIGQTTSIAFRIDTVPPTNVSVIAPKISTSRHIQLKLGAGGATDMYISNASYQTGGDWESLSQKREWQLTPGRGNKPIFAQFRDKAGNISQIQTLTNLSLELPKFSIQLTAGEYGQISPQGTVIKEEGENLTVEITPNKYYRINRFTIDNKAISSDVEMQSYTFENIKQNHTLDVSFERALFKIVSSSGENGSIFPDGEIVVEKGSSQSFTITSSPEYAIDKLLLDMEPVQWTGNPFVISEITTGHQLFVTFTRAYTVTVETDENGQVLPSGNISVGEGSYQSFEIIPNPNYNIDKVLVNDEVVDIRNNTLTLYNVQQPYHIQASFKKGFLTIESTSSINGRIEPEGIFQVKKNAEKAFKIIPDEGFELESLLIDGLPTSHEDTYTFTNITGNHNIAAKFHAKQFVIHSQAGPNGSVEPSGDSAVPWGNERILIAEPVPGYAVDQALLDGEPVILTAGYYYRLSNIQKDYDFQVSFKRVHEIATITSGNGQILPGGIVPVEAGQDQVFQILPDHGFELERLQADAAFVDHEDMTYTFKEVNYDHQLIAIFSPTPVYITATSGVNGIISPAGVMPYDMGSTATFFLQANPGYEIFSLTVDDTTMPYTSTRFDLIVDAPHIIHVAFTKMNDAPTVSDNTFGLIEDQLLCKKLFGEDGDGDRITFKIMSAPTFGSAILTDVSEGLFCYTPVENANGTDQFTYVVTDGHKTSNLGTIFLVVEPQNDTPQALNDHWTLNEDSLFESTLEATDIDDDPLTFTIVEKPSLGQAILMNSTTGKISYQPFHNNNGEDRLLFQVSDGQTLSNTAEVIIDIQPINDAPVAYSNTLETGRGQAVRITLVASDVDYDPLDFQIVSVPQSGILTPLGNLVLEYQPYSQFIGTDYFEFQIDDGQSLSNKARISVVIGTISAITSEEFPVTLDAQAGATIIQIPAHGKLQWISEKLVYTPSKDYVGYDTVRYQNPDDPVIREIVIRIDPINDPPQLTQLATIFLNEDEFQTITVVATDPDADPLTFTYTSPNNGEIISFAPVFNYYPQENFHGNDQFEVTVSDGEFDISMIIHLTVQPKNDRPVVGKLETISVMEDQSVNITIHATDIDKDPLSLEILTSPKHGHLSNNTPDMLHLSYTPENNFFGWDQFSFVVTDDLAKSEVNTLSIHVLSVNDIAVAHPMQVTGIENREVKGQLSGSDIENQKLTYELATLAENGIVSITPTTGKFIYTPAKEFYGNDTFSFVVNDGYGQSLPSIVEIYIHPGNSPPIAADDELTAKEDEAITSTLKASDENNDDLIFRISMQASLGKVQLIDPQTGEYQYLARPNTHGNDLFSFIVNDGILDSNEANVFVVIQPMNDKPAVNDSQLEMDEDSESMGTITGTDIDGDSLTFEIVQLPEKGLVELTNAETGAYRYSPFHNQHGTDTFQFIAHDGTTHSLTGTVSIVINPKNDTPAAIPLTLYTIEDIPMDGKLEGSDIDGDSLIFMFADEETPVSSGMLEMTDSQKGEFRYFPAKNQSGTFLFQYYASDGLESSAPVSLTIVVNPANDPPEVFNQNLITEKDETLEITLSGYDIDQDLLSFEIIQPPAKGRLKRVDNIWAYTPKTGFQGKDAFTYQANDSNGGLSNIGKISIRVGVPDAAIYTDEDTPILIDLFAITDFNPDDVSDVKIEQPEHGTLSGNGFTRTYLPESNYSGIDTFTVSYIISDQTILKQVKMFIIAVNDPPKMTGFLPLPAFTNEDEPLTITVFANDPESDPLTFKLAQSPEHGQATIKGNKINYTPSTDFNGEDHLTVSVTDNFNDVSSSQRIDIQVIPVNDPPVISPITVNTLEETQVTFTLKGFDPDGDDLTFFIQQPVSDGVISGDSPQFTYIPNKNFFGTDRPTFRASDGQSTSEAAEIIIQVKNTNDVPRVKSSIFYLTNPNELSDRLPAEDDDGDLLIYTIDRQPENGLLVLDHTGGTFVYYPKKNGAEKDSFTYHVFDGTTTSLSAEALIFLNPESPSLTARIHLTAPYKPLEDLYEYMFIDADTGKVLINGTSAADTIEDSFPEGRYRLIILAKNYKPYEYEKDNLNYFELTKDIEIDVTLTEQPMFDPHPPGVDISYMTISSGLTIWAVKKNMELDDPLSMSIQRASGKYSIDSGVTGHGTSNSPYTFSWTPSDPATKFENGVYEIQFTFDGIVSGHEQELQSITLFWHSNDTRKRNSSKDQTEIIAAEFDQYPSYVTQGTCEFYPLVGIDCHATLIDNSDMARHMTIHIPPIPLEYLYIDDADDNNGGQLKYNSETDRYEVNRSEKIVIIDSDEKLTAEIAYYTIGGDHPGNAISLSFYKTNGLLEGKPIRFNPMLGGENNHLIHAPTIELPIYLNPHASTLNSFEDMDLAIRVYERGDGIQGFGTENRASRIESNQLVYVEMNHLTLVGLNLATKENPNDVSTSSSNDESSSGCFIKNIHMENFLWHEIISFLIICLIIGLIWRIQK